MADIANLARHLLMAEVLQICNSVHRQVEEQKLTVYQRGDIHTVVSSQPAPQGPKEDAYMVTIHDGGGVAVACESLTFVAPAKEPYAEQQAVVEGEAAADDGPDEQHDTVTLIAHSGDAEPGDTVTFISRGADATDGETMTVVTHSGQAGASESLAMVSACLAMEQPRVAEEGSFVVGVEPDTASHAPAEAVEAPQERPDSGPLPPKRKRGRPAKVKKDVEEFLPPEEEDAAAAAADQVQADKQEAASDDPNRRRLRQRSIGEGGYARLHMGLEEEEEGRKVSTPPRTTPPKVPCHCYFVK